MALPIIASAYDCQVDGIYYNLNSEEKTAEVTNGIYFYSGSIDIPKKFTYEGVDYSVTSIGRWAFQSCGGLTSVTIPNSVTRIRGGAFEECRGLTSIIIPNSVTIIEWDAFRKCIGLTSVTIPNSVISIDAHSFDGCSGLTSVTIGNSVTSIGNFAFDGCSGLTSVHITDLDAWCKIAFSSDFSNPLSFAHHLYLNGEEIKDLVIPNSVTSIGADAFQGCTNITSVTIPNSVTSIGGNAFHGCTYLTSVYITDLEAWCKISFEFNAYSNPLIYSHHLYLNGEEIKNLVIPNSITTIGDWAFYTCRSLTSVTIPNTVTNIGYCAFGECFNLTSVTIPNSATTIGDFAFLYCRNLTSVTIPNSVTSIKKAAFDGCSHLSSVISKMVNPCEIYSNCFPDDVYNNVTLYVPQGTIDKYKSTDCWNKFLNIEEGDPGSVAPEAKKCATPTISYADKKLTFSCETEEVEFVSKITDADIKDHNGSEISLTATYNISVYATKSGYTNSDVATATLVWTDAIFTVTTPETPTSAKAVQESIPVLISAKGGNISVKCEADGQEVNVYTIDGLSLGTATVKNGEAQINTSIPSGDVAVVKVGGKSVKVVMR